MLGYWRFSGAWKRVTFSGMENQPDRKSLLDAYRVPGFRARSRVDGIGGDPPVFVITLDRRSKKRCAAPAANLVAAFTTTAGVGRAILAAEDARFISTSRWPA
jgi:hypothetical protein